MTHDFQVCTYKYCCYEQHIRKAKTGAEESGVECEAMEKDEGKKSRNKYSADKITLEHFVSTMVPLIDMEKETEISVSMNSGAMRSLDIAQKKGSTILNLKCVDAQTGLLGKSLLEFHPNKGDVLPPHRVLSGYNAVTYKA